MTQTILVVDDDPNIQRILQYTLSQAGFHVKPALEARRALDYARAKAPDLVVLDIQLPDLSGIEVCRLLKEDPRTREIPIIMLTVRGGESDKVSAFETGSEDYMTKPFSTKELLLRVRALLQRSGKPEALRTLQAGELTMDLAGHRAELKGKPIELTAVEFRLLAHLVQNPGVVIERDMLLDRVWGIEAEIDTRTVDTHVWRLRNKLGPLGRNIQTVRNVGYRFSI
ncbi:MAG: response regulator [Nitrospirae bacterium]|nr:response regulator [Nitrospirota bacterium]